MDAISELVERLERMDVELWLEDGKVRYKAPAGRLTPEILGHLRTQRSTLLAHLSQRAPRPGHVSSATPAAPLALAQMGWHYMEKTGQLSPWRILKSALRLRGPLDVHALKSAIAHIVRRHGALRTRIVEMNGEPAQVVDPSSPAAEVAVISRSELPEAFAHESTGHDLQLLTPVCFDVQQGPLFRAWLLELAPQEHILVTAIHHIVCDAWSIELLQAELRRFYEAYANGSTPELPAPMQFNDYARWERQWAPAAALESHKRFWEGVFHDAAPLDLPVDTQRKPGEYGDSTELDFTIDAAALERLRTLAASLHTTVFVILLSALNMAAARWSRQDGICVACVTSGRLHPDAAAIIGCFPRLIVVRTDLTGADTCRAAIERTAASFAVSLDHQVWGHYVLARERQLHRLEFNYIPAQFSATSAGNAAGALRTEKVRMPSPELTTNGYEIRVLVFESQGGLVGRFQFDSDLFRRATAESLLSSYTRILSEMPAA